MSERGARSYAVLLGALALAFLGRVAGQVVVAFASPAWLPPMEEWYSGLVPYPILLPIQIAILLVQVWISRDLWREEGRFWARRPRAGLWLRRFAALYFAVMLARYVVTMAMFPERRWLTGTIPIFFHWVLAAYLWVYARWLRRP